MTIRPHPTFAVALATALVGAAPAVAGADEEPVAVHCFTQALTLEEIDAGVYSEIECYPITEEPAQSRLLNVDWAIIYTGKAGAGTALTVSGPSCTGGGMNFAPGSFWNDSISSTDLLACGNAKHWTGNNLSGSHQLVSGAGIHDMNATLNDATSSIEYA